MVPLLLLAFCVPALSRVTHEPSLALEVTLCEKYACNDDRFQLFDSQCVYYDSINITYFLQNCDSDSDASYCPPSYEANSTCSTPPSPNLYTAFPGEYCLQQNWCKYGYCQNSTCVGQKLGSYCVTSGECDIGLRCDNTTCVEQIPISESGCLTDFDCVNNAGCDAGTCQGYFSIPALNYVGLCTNETSLLCESGFCYYGMCLDAPISEAELPVSCVSQFDCLSMTHFKAEGLKFYTECECGYNPTGIQYCQPFMGDKPARQYLDFLKDWLNTTEITRCNTLRRLEPECIQTVMEGTNAEKFVYYQTWGLNYPQVIEAPLCVQDVYFPTYLTDETAIVATLGALLLLAL